MTSANTNAYEQVYNINEDNTLPSKVEIVICVLVQRGLLAAGFSNTKELLTLHYTGYNKNKPVWEVGFFEQLFVQEPLLNDHNKVKGVFILGDKNLIVPDELYDKAQAENWLKHIFFVEQSDVIKSYRVNNPQVNYLMALPVHITELILINFKNAATLPLVFYQFNNAAKEGAGIQCCITAEQVCATLHNNGQLLWHKVFDYTNAEDIVYGIMQVCTENNISQFAVSLKCTTLCAGESGIIHGLSQYFTGITSGMSGKASTHWHGAIYLAKQLISCV